MNIQIKKGGANFKDGSNWAKTPGNMLRACVISNALEQLEAAVKAAKKAVKDLQAEQKQRRKF